MKFSIDSGKKNASDVNVFRGYILADTWILERLKVCSEFVNDFFISLPAQALKTLTFTIAELLLMLYLSLIKLKSGCRDKIAQRLTESSRKNASDSMTGKLFPWLSNHVHFFPNFCEICIRFFLKISDKKQQNISSEISFKLIYNWFTRNLRYIEIYGQN